MDTKMNVSSLLEIFGYNLYTADHTEAVFGFRPKDAPLPPYWNLKDYEAHAAAGDYLICYPNGEPNMSPMTLEVMAKRALSKKSFSNPLFSRQFSHEGDPVSDLIRNDPLIHNGMLRPGWQFVSPHVLPETGSRDFVEQTNVLIENMERLLGDSPPSAFLEAKKKWKSEQQFVAKTLIEMDKPEAAAFFLASLDCTRFLREPVQNTFYRYLLVYGITGVKLFPNDYSWSGSVSSDGRLVCFGDAVAGGADVDGSTPDDSSSCLCAVTSRSGF